MAGFSAAIPCPSVGPRPASYNSRIFAEVPAKSNGKLARENYNFGLQTQ